MKCKEHQLVQVDRSSCGLHHITRMRQSISQNQFMKGIIIYAYSNDRSYVTRDIKMSAVHSCTTSNNARKQHGHDTDQFYI